MAKNKKLKSAVPKRLGGVKIPKAVRKGGLPALLASPVALGVISNFISDATEAMMARESKPDSGARKAARTTKHGLHSAADEVTGSASALTFALGEAARTFIDSLRNGAPESLPEPIAGEPTTAAARRRGAAYPQPGPASH